MLDSFRLATAHCRNREVDKMTPFKDGEYTYTEGSTVFRILIKDGQPYISSNNPAKRFVDIFKVLNPDNWNNA